MKTIGLVVPTLGIRPDYLEECLESIRANEIAFVNLVAPPSFDPSLLFRRGLIDSFTPDAGRGLAGAINDGFESLPTNLELIAWLGDDDVLAADSLRTASDMFTSGVVAVFGDCNFMDEDSTVFWKLRTGQWAVALLSWGPNKIPQPGSLFRRASVEVVGKLDESLGWAFDQDLFLKLRSLGEIRYVRKTLASFRWHSTSLSSGSSSKSVREAASVRIRHTKKRHRTFAKLREYVHVRLALSVRSTLDRKNSHS